MHKAGHKNGYMRKHIAKGCSVKGERRGDRNPTAPSPLLSPDKARRGLAGTQAGP